MGWGQKSLTDEIQSCLIWLIFTLIGCFVALNSMGSSLGAASRLDPIEYSAIMALYPPIAEGWLRESTTVHVFLYHAQDLLVKKGTLGDPGGGGLQKAFAQPPTLRCPSIFFKKKHVFNDFGLRCLPETVGLDPSRGIVVLFHMLTRNRFVEGD